MGGAGWCEALAAARLEAAALITAARLEAAAEAARLEAAEGTDDYKGLCPRPSFKSRSKPLCRSRLLVVGRVMGAQDKVICNE